MDSDSGALVTTAVAGNGDVHRAAPRGKQATELGGAAVAEDGACPAREYRGDPSSFVAQRRMADCINAAIKAVKPSRRASWQVVRKPASLRKSV